MGLDSDLALAKTIVRAGIPVVLWRADSPVPPKGWPTAVPDETIIDQWQPGDRLYAVTGVQPDGRGVDIADVDPRNGGMETLRALVEQGVWPTGCGVVSTPSGGRHIWLPPSGSRKGHPGEGIDYQAGAINERGECVGRGLAAIPPSSGSLTTPNGTYAWVEQVNFSALRSAPSDQQRRLVALLRHSNPPRGAAPAPKIELPVEARAVAIEWETKYSNAKLGKLAELLTKDHKPGLWDETVYGVARDLVRLTNADWSTATLDSLHPLYIEACQLLTSPHDSEWTTRMSDKWDRAVVEVDDAVPMPPEVLRLAAGDAPMSFTDDGNAQLFVDHYQQDIRYVPQAKTQWHVWNGWMWIPDERNRTTELARDVLRELPELDGETRSHKNRSLNIGGIKACITLASSDARVTADQSTFDTDPYILNTPGGVVNLKTGEIREHTREDLLSRVTACAPQAGPHPLWDKFLADTFRGLPDEAIPFVQTMFGYSISGSVDFDFMPFFYGTGQNGKTVMAQTLYRLLNTYAGYAPSGLLTKENYNHETTKAFLFGKRFVVVSEENENAAFNEARVKEYSGGEPLTARFMRRDDFTWQPTQKIWILANDKPAVKSGGEAFWRRVKIVEFRNKVRDEDRILDLEDRLVNEEGPAILAWAIEGAVRVFRDGLIIPKFVADATKEYANEEDDLQRFLDERTKPSAEGRVKKTDLQARYRGWCEENGIVPKNNMVLGRALKKKGLDLRGNGKTEYWGLELVDTYTSSLPSLSPESIQNMLNIN